MSPFGLFAPLVEYMVDAAQRSVLFWDTLRERGNQYREHQAKTVPHVLDYGVELIVDGRTLLRPVNYALARVVPPAGFEIDPKRRPFIIVDPRAGHGPGIGGFKADSEIGVAFKAGHPCYFIGFLPDPMPGQTIEDISRAEAIFIENVIALHPEADGKPCVIGNCQAGWAVMMLAAVRPELFGPIIVAGSPLSYWAGVRGKNPMRCTGGLLGGSWLTAFASDLGHGKFDGAWLVQNPLAFDNAIDAAAAKIKGIKSDVAGRAQILVVPDLEAGNMLAKNLVYLAKADAAGLVLGARVPIVLTSRADSVRSRMASCAAAVLYAHARRGVAALPAA